MSKTVSPTLQSLQNHLIELQLYLRQREEAKSSHVLAMRELDSIEAKYRRDKEIEQAHLKADHERRMQEDRIQHERLEAERARKHQLELERQKIEADRIATKARASQEKEFAEARKLSQEKLFNEQVARQRGIEENRQKEELSYAKERIARFKQSNRQFIRYFEDSLLPIIQESELMNVVLEADIELRKIEPSIQLISDFLDSLEAIGYNKQLVVKCLNIQVVDDFLDLAPKLKYLLNQVPASGMDDCVALDEEGQIIPPWALGEAIAYHHPSNGKIVCLGSVSDNSPPQRIPHNHAVILLSEMNRRKLCGQENWRIPNNEDLKDINLDTLSGIGLQVPEFFWIEYANAVGRLSAFDRLNSRRIVTGSSDKFHPIFVSSK